MTEVPPGYTAYAATPSPRHRRNGWLIASGVISLVIAIPLIVLGAAAIFAGASDRASGWGELVAAVGIVIGGYGLIVGVGAIGAIRSRTWGAVVIIVLMTPVLLMWAAGSLEVREALVGSVALAAMFTALVGIAQQGNGRPPSRQ